MCSGRDVMCNRSDAMRSRSDVMCSRRYMIESRSAVMESRRYEMVTMMPRLCVMFLFGIVSDSIHR